MVVRVRRRRPIPPPLGCRRVQFYIYIYLIILQKYTTVLKFYNINNHSPWPTAVSDLRWAAGGFNFLYIYIFNHFAEIYDGFKIL
jgi:hypothetical protein